MPLSEDDKKELVKKIMEQRKAMWSGEVVSKQKPKKIKEAEIKQLEEVETIPEKQPDTMLEWNPFKDTDHTLPTKMDIGIRRDSGSFGSVTEVFKSSGELVKSRLKTEIESSVELTWKLTFKVIMGLIGVILFGVIIGYLSSILGLIKKI